MKFINYFAIFFAISLFLSPIISNSRTVWHAPAGHHWATPNGSDSQDGRPRKQSTRKPNGNVTCGGCDPTYGTCWETINDGVTVIIYDSIVAGGTADDSHEFVPEPDGPGGI